ncbi:SDR family NAD(P)-dependent oxidoreductase [Nitrospira sp. Nam74]
MAQDRRARTVLITGGSRGIGRALCLAFARAGWQVGVHYRERKAEAEHTIALMAEDGSEAMTHQADIRDPMQVELMIKNVVASYGRLDVMICNAGVSASRLLLRLTSEEWGNILATNLTGTFHCVQSAGRQMIEQGDGSIVVVSSYAGLHGDVGQSAYAASKAGLLGLVKVAAREWGRHNVRVNAVLPGWHKTELSGTAMPSEAEINDHMLGRTPTLEDIACSIVHLATSQDMSGQVWNLDSRLS